VACEDLFENPADQGFIIYEQYPCSHRSTPGVKVGN